MLENVITEDQKINVLLEQLIKNCSYCKSAKDEKLIRKAFKMANEAHKGMRRKSGDPFIIHPLEVAVIVSEEIGLGVTSTVCAILHDVVEDTQFTEDDIIETFGTEVAGIVAGVTQLGAVPLKGARARQAENIRKMFLAMASDVRVVFIKFADRLHNMETLYAMPKHKQERTARETREIYAPIAGRLGMAEVKGELEDMAFSYLQPKD